MINSKSALCYYNANNTSEPGRDARTYDWKLLNYLKQSDWIIDLFQKPFSSCETKEIVISRREISRFFSLLLLLF